MIRKTIFWVHLSCGVLTGLVVFTMSLTGVLLTYERQIDEWVGQRYYVPVAEQQNRLPLEELISLQKLAQPEANANTAIISKDAGAPVSFRAGRRGSVALNPYTGEAMQTESPRLSAFFSTLTGFHRWFNIEGEHRAFARQVTGISNVVFLFLVLSGMYLWLPKLYRWTIFKARLFFKGQYPDSKTRDFHWHHIFGIWTALPLLAVVYSGAVISYPWAANLMYRAFGAEVPVALPAPPPGQNPANGGNQNNRNNNAGAAEIQSEVSATYQSLESLLEAALAQTNYDWKRLSLTLPKTSDSTLTLEIDEGNGAQAHLRHTLTLDRSNGTVLSSSGFSELPLTQKLRTTARFLHTGEVLGFWGQTIAGLASLAALFLVWTGFALSYRRLLQPLFSKR